jgi:hypothetical protein
LKKNSDATSGARARRTKIFIPGLEETESDSGADGSDELGEPAQGSAQRPLQGKCMQGINAGAKRTRISMSGAEETETDSSAGGDAERADPVGGKRQGPKQAKHSQDNTPTTQRENPAGPRPKKTKLEKTRICPDAEESSSFDPEELEAEFARLDNESLSDSVVSMSAGNSRNPDGSAPPQPGGRYQAWLITVPAWAIVAEERPAWVKKNEATGELACDKGLMHDTLRHALKVYNANMSPKFQFDWTALSSVAFAELPLKVDELRPVEGAAALSLGEYLEKRGMPESGKGRDRLEFCSDTVEIHSFEQKIKFPCPAGRGLHAHVVVYYTKGNKGIRTSHQWQQHLHKRGIPCYVSVFEEHTAARRHAAAKKRALSYCTDPRKGYVDLCPHCSHNWSWPASDQHEKLLRLMKGQATRLEMKEYVRKKSAVSLVQVTMDLEREISEHAQMLHKNREAWRKMFFAKLPYWRLHNYAQARLVGRGKWREFQEELEGELAERTRNWTHYDHFFGKIDNISVNDLA